MRLKCINLNYTYNCEINILILYKHIRIFESNVINPQSEVLDLMQNILSQTKKKKEAIRITCPCNIYPLISHFYTVKLGFAGVYLFFLFLL